jgi:hypothetical protein
MTGNPGLLEAPNPFDDSDIILGCPKCKAVDAFALVCDEPDCPQDATCGFPVKEGYGGYRNTCYYHMKLAELAKAKGANCD